MNRYMPYLDWIDTQHNRMCSLVTQWAAINTGSTNLAGLEQLTPLICEAFDVLGGERQLIDLPPRQSIDFAGQICQSPLGKAIGITKRSESKHRVFLGIHMDTVYPPDQPTPAPQRTNDNILRGQGVADAKGGLVVMLVALEALERSGLAQQMGWEILINPDEEIGSPGSMSLLRQCAGRNHVGLVFEPTLADGTLAGPRGGSGNFTAVIRGKAAHAGRQFHLGHSAIDAAAALITALSALNGEIQGATVNVGRVEGGGAVNVVPDLAICRFNIRINEPLVQDVIDERVQQIIKDVNQRDGILAELHGGWTSPPKPMDGPTQALFELVASCGNDLRLSIRWKATGGVCDGNKLAAAGLPTIDTLGPRGGDIHSPDEYLLLDSLTERAKLTSLLLMKLACGDLPWPVTQ